MDIDRKRNANLRCELLIYNILKEKYRTESMAIGAPINKGLKQENPPELADFPASHATREF